MQQQNNSDQPKVETPVVQAPVEYSTQPPLPPQMTDPTFYVLALVVFVRCLKIP
jgi:hypothetical protein